MSPEELQRNLAQVLWSDDSQSEVSLSATMPGTQRVYEKAAGLLLPVAQRYAAEVLEAAAYDMEQWPSGFVGKYDAVRFLRRRAEDAARPTSAGLPGDDRGGQER